MSFDLVTLIQPYDGGLVVDTCIGIRMRVQPNFTVSAVSGVYDTVVFCGPPEEVSDRMFAATIIVPPGYSYRILGVEWCSEMQNGSAQTAVETASCVMNVGGGDDAIRRVAAPSSVLVESHE